MYYNAQASLTFNAAALLGEALQNGNRVCEIKWFSAGTGGHDPQNTFFAKAINPATLSLDGQIIPPLPISLIENKGLVTYYVCRIDDSQMVGGVISNIGLWAEVNNPQDPTDPINGKQILFAVANFPLITKIPNSPLEISVALSFI